METKPAGGYWLSNLKLNHIWCVSRDGEVRYCLFPTHDLSSGSFWLLSSQRPRFYLLGISSLELPSFLSLTFSLSLLVDQYN